MTIYAKRTERDNSKQSIVMTIGKNEVLLFGKNISVDAAPIIPNDRKMIPIRIVAENLGSNVEWKEEGQQIVVTKKINICIDPIKLLWLKQLPREFFG